MRLQRPAAEAARGSTAAARGRGQARQRAHEGRRLAPPPAELAEVELPMLGPGAPQEPHDLWDLPEEAGPR
eukprot:10322762-Lingulodinium_polyedra.AAC.1